MKLLCGKHAGCKKGYWWEIPEDVTVACLYKGGDYAIVENKGDYAMVKVIAIVDTNEKYVFALTGVSKGRFSKVVKFLFRNDVRAD